MTAKTKITLIVWWIFTFIWWWIFLVMSMMSGAHDPSTDIIKSGIVSKDTQKEQTPKDEKQDSEEQKDKKDEEKKTEESPKDSNENIENNSAKENKDPYSLKVLTFSGISDAKTEKLFNFKFKKQSWWTVEFKSYNNLKEYNKDLVYQLATKTADFDFAIIPSHWYKDITKSVEWLEDFYFQIKTPWFNISSIFDYNFESFIKDNNIRAIPFAIDPIVWYANNQNNNILDQQTFKSWKDIIIKNPNRVTVDWKISNMPIFLWYDEDYLKFLEKNDSLFPIFDNLFRYYILKNSEEWIKLLKDFWNNMINKTFSLELFKKNIVKYRKYDFCKTNIQLCFILWWDSEIVYDFLANSSFYKENALEIFKQFKIRPSQIKLTTPALWDSSNEYPARWRIMLINPKIDQNKFIRFLQTYIKMGKQNELPFYKYLISPFVWIKTSKQHDFFDKYIWRFILLEKFGVNLQNRLDKKELNYLNGSININNLFN